MNHFANLHDSQTRPAKMQHAFADHTDRYLCHRVNRIEFAGNVRVRVGLCRSDLSSELILRCQLFGIICLLCFECCFGDFDFKPLHVRHEIIERPDCRRRRSRSGRRRRNKRLDQRAQCRNLVVQKSDLLSEICNLIIRGGQASLRQRQGIRQFRSSSSIRWRHCRLLCANSPLFV